MFNLVEPSIPPPSLGSTGSPAAIELAAGFPFWACPRNGRRRCRLLTAVHNGVRNARNFSRHDRTKRRFPAHKTLMSDAGAKANRPLSPHLQIYRWPLTMV